MNSASSPRLAQLQALLTESPDDPFLKYGIALEMTKIHPADGLAKLQELTQSHPDYLPTYYRLASLLVENDKEEAAKPVIEAGLNLAKVQNEALAYKELQALLNSLEDA